jgi:hypothetical protein
LEMIATANYCIRQNFHQDDSYNELIAAPLLRPAEEFY